MSKKHPLCPNGCSKHPNSECVIRTGHYYRKSDRRKIQRYRCARCRLNFSQATFLPEYRQNKRNLNYKIGLFLASGVSMRRTAFLLNVRFETIARKKAFLGLKCRHFNYLKRKRLKSVTQIQFDDLETFEHTKMKPLSVTLAVEKGTRFILGFEVSRMPAKGLLAKKSREKYGPRKDEREEARERLFRRIQPIIASGAIIQSDSNPHYKASVQKFFPDCQYITVKGRRGCVTGQGELKAGGFDPLFSLNHTCAMFRANMSRLFRRTWNTTKKIQPLIDHIEIYVKFHNEVLLDYNK